MLYDTCIANALFGGFVHVAEAFREKKLSVETSVNQG